MTRRPAAAVVIPAHDEIGALGRCLQPLAPAAAAGDIEVVVACNGCHDATADLARAISGVRVVEIETASKTAALRAGDAAVSAFPRVYLDADVALPLTSLHAVVELLERGPALACRPPLRYSYERSVWSVRQYYAARHHLPAVLGSLWGAGVYALNRAGRERFDDFPDVVGDDLWIDNMFEPDEIAIATCDPVVVTVPRHAGDLIKILRRAQSGKREASTATQFAATSVRAGLLSELTMFGRTGPREALQATVYAGFAAAARGTRTFATQKGWERDESSR
jgi:hypothetical protein